MKRTDFVLIGILSLVFMLTACHDDEKEETPKVAEQTVLMYMPWADDTRMYNACKKNIIAMKTAIEYQRGLNGKRLLTFIAETANRALLVEIKYERGVCVDDTIKRYQSLAPSNFTTADGVAAFFKDVVAAAPAKSYGLTIGCHGMGWLPVETSKSKAKRQAAPKVPPYRPNSYFVDEKIQTRYFGSHQDQPLYQTEISVLKTAITNSFGHLDFLLFDDCYMQNIETAYQLKGITDHIIASTCEVMMEGIPYATVGSALLRGDYAAVVSGFYEFYKSYKWPYGTLSVVKTSELDNTAQLMKTINAQHQWDTENNKSLQAFDDYYRNVFYDMGSYVRNLCGDDETLAKQMEEQLNRLVLYKAHTEYFYASEYERRIKMEEFSGISISDPSTSSKAETKETTDWWKATH